MKTAQKVFSVKMVSDLAQFVTTENAFAMTIMSTLSTATKTFAKETSDTEIVARNIQTVRTS
jgi:hypothetical protein